MKKGISKILCVLVLFMSLASIPVFASSEASFSFSLLRGANSTPSDVAYKSDYANADIYPQYGYISAENGDKIAMRIRDANRNYASGLYEVTQIKYFAMWYFDPVPGNYYLYANAPSSNYSQYVNITGVWYP